VVELFETLLTRNCGDRSRHLREYLLLLAQLSEKDGSLLERKTRAGTVLAEEQPQALAAAIGDPALPLLNESLFFVRGFAHSGIVDGQ
jgi:hypothetical protein